MDCTANKVVCSRFQIKGYPTLLYFKNGQYAAYRGSRALATLEEFAVGRGGDAAEWTPVPPLPGFTSVSEPATCVCAPPNASDSSA